MSVDSRRENADDDLFHALEAEDVLERKAAEAPVCRLILVLKWLATSIQPLNAGVLETSVHVDFERALLVYSLRELLTDGLVEDHEINEGVAGLGPLILHLGRRGSMPACGLDVLLAFGQRVHEDLSAQLCRKFHEWAAAIGRRDGSFVARRYGCGGLSCHRSLWDSLHNVSHELDGQSDARLLLHVSQVCRRRHDVCDVLEVSKNVWWKSCAFLCSASR